MSRKLILTIATAATVAMASLASQSAEAHGGFGGFGGGRGFGSGHTFGGHGFAFGGARSFRGVFHHPILLPITTPVHLKPIIPHFPLPKFPLPTAGGPNPHHHWAYHDGHWSLDVDVGGDVELAPAVVVAPAAPVQTSPAGCLTKTYTPTALVVFADTCTGESASAPVDSAADAAQTPTSPVSATATPIAQVPTAPNYAGRTYADFLAANPQFAQPQATSAQPQPVTAQPEAAQD